MDAYKCAYRDAKSPLTPLTPITTNKFDFDNITPTAAKGSLLSVPKPVNKAAVKSPAVRSAETSRLLWSNKKPPQLLPTYNSNSRQISENDRAGVLIYSKKKIEYKQYNNGSKVITKYQEYVVKPSSELRVNSVIAKYHLSPCVKPTLKKQSVVYGPPTSPVAPKALCPKLASILTQIQMAKYLKLFEVEEIDYAVFKLMTEQDLLDIGIRAQIDRDIILNAIRYWSDFY